MTARRPLLVLAAASLTAAAAAAGVLVLRDRAPDRLMSSDGAEAGPVIRDGERVRVSGRVVQVPGSAPRACAPEVVAGIGYGPGGEPAPKQCARGMDLVGADMQRLSSRREKDGAVEGFAVVTGTLDGDRIVVSSQEPMPEQRDAPFEPTVPPCPEPAGGWPREEGLMRGPGSEPEGDANLQSEQPALDRYRAEHPADVLDVALLRPHPDSVVLGVLAPDDAARQRVERGLRATYGERLCVVVSRYRQADVDAAGRELGLGPGADRAAFERHGVSGGSTGIRFDLQLHAEADVVRVTPELQEVVGRYPDGLVVLRPWLQRA